MTLQGLPPLFHNIAAQYHPLLRRTYCTSSFKITSSASASASASTLSTASSPSAIVVNRFDSYFCTAPYSLYPSNQTSQRIMREKTSARVLTEGERPSANKTHEAPVSPSKVIIDRDKILSEIISIWTARESLTRWYWCIPPKSEYLKPNAKWHELDSRLSCLVAGTAGLLSVYRGGMSGLQLRGENGRSNGRKEEIVLQLCRDQLTKKEVQLEVWKAILPEGKYTKLLYFYQISGIALGWIPTIITGNHRLMCATIDVLETILEEELRKPILKELGAISAKKEEGEKECPNLIKLLQLSHREDAEAREELMNINAGSLDSFGMRSWQAAVKWGSSCAAGLATRR